MVIANSAIDQDAQPSNHLFVPGRNCIVAFDLFQTFGAASLSDADYCPGLLTLPESSVPYSTITDLRVTDDGKVLTFLAGHTAYVVQLPDTLVRPAAHAIPQHMLSCITWPG